MHPSLQQQLSPRSEKRSAAFESIFGRSTAVHHQQPVDPNANANYYPQHQQYPQQSPPGPSGSGSFRHRSPPPNGHAHSHSLSQQGSPPQPTYHGSPPVSYRQATLQYDGRSRRSEAGVIAPTPPPVGAPTDYVLEALERTGLTPAQAYQQQVNIQSTPGPGSSWEEALRGEPPRQDDASTRSNGNRLGHVQEEGDLASEIARGFARMGSSSPFDSSFSAESLSTVRSGTGTGPSPARNHIDLSTPPISIATTDYSTTVTPSGSTSRRSTDSARTLPYALTRREKTFSDRSRSMSANIDKPVIPPSPTITARRAPIVYPAMVSRVAEAFRERVVLSERVKDGLTYTECFDGREAVDKITYIIKTTDRNLALLLGRALDAQKFFHDVTYDRRLRDSHSELYQFRSRLQTPFPGGEVGGSADSVFFQGRPVLEGKDSGEGTECISSPVTPAMGNEAPFNRIGSPDTDTLVSKSTDFTHGHGHDSILSEDDSLPTGVFTLLTDCYSPTCSRNQLCYSIVCPRRLEQQAHLNMKPQQVLKKTISNESLGDVDLAEPGTLWIHSVPKEIADTVSDTEKKRQEAINEVIYTERDFVRDMEYLRDIWLKPLQSSDVLPESRRTDFLEQVFWNLRDIIAVNSRLRDALNKRQRSYAVVEKIGDILLDAVPHFEPFVTYGSHQLYGKYEFEKEKGSNPAFARFVEETERRPESRKLELNGYLTKPTTRLARYPLLLQQVLKHTSDDSPDKQTLTKVIEMVREFLAKVNEESGKSENRFNLWQLDQQLVFKPGESADLRLRDEVRELVYKGNLSRRGGTAAETGDLLLFLFDHALLIVKQQKTKFDQYKVYRKPIPLELLHVISDDDVVGRPATVRPAGRTLTRRHSFTKPSASTPNLSPMVNVAKVTDSKYGYPITFVHLGKQWYSITLYASTWVGRKKWLENIAKQQTLMNERSSIFSTVTLSEGFFIGSNKVNCAAPFGYGRRIAYGTDEGVYFSDLTENHREPMKVLALQDVAQVDILEEYQLLIVLAEKQVMTIPLDALDPRDTLAGFKRAKRVSSHTSFFKTGVCMGRPLVCVVKTSPLSSTIKTMEPIEQHARGKNKPTFKKLLQGGHDTLRLFKEFYIPVESSSIHFLKTRLCVGCAKGFEIVDLLSLETQGLIDPADATLDFVHRAENVKAMAIYRVENDFLLCYDAFAFYVNKSGWRSKKHFMVHWEGIPTAFAFHYPYVIAFEPTFVEIRHVETGLLAQIIKGQNLRCMFADIPPSTTNTPMPSLGGRGQAQYEGYPQQQMYGHPIPGQSPHMSPQYRRPAPVYNRDEIVLSSDDRIMLLQLATLQSDSASAVSSFQR